MKTRIQLIRSSARPLHDFADLALSNQVFSKARNMFSRPLQEEVSSFIASVPVPGLSKEDLTVHIEGRVLIISAKAQSRMSESNSKSKCMDLKHSFVVPDGIDTNRIRAKCRNGLLTIYFEKVNSKKSHALIKVNGIENGVSENRRLNTLWSKIKEKLDIRRMVQNVRETASS